MVMMQQSRLRHFVAPTGAVLGLTVAVLAADSTPNRIDRERLLTHLKRLASDELSGRANGSGGLDRAAEYIAARFREAGLEAAGDGGSFFQPFFVTMPPEPGAQRTIIISGPSGDTRFRLGLEFHPLFVRDAEANQDDIDELGLVFAGYGISAPGLGYDDYQGLDVSGKAVIVFTHEPQEDDPTSVFDGDALTPYADIGLKAAQAAERGARLLVVVEDPKHVVDRALAPDWASDPQIDDLKVPVLRVDRARLARAVGLDFRALARRIDAPLAPQSVALGNAVLTFDRSTAVTRARVRNVVGLLRGADSARARDAIIVGAPYDHLGVGGRSAAESTAAGLTYRGGDADPSGTAAILEIARVAAARRPRLPRTLVFAAFAAEGIAQLGSKHYVRYASIPASRTVAMIHLDMIGRAGGRVRVGGRHGTLDVRSRLDRLAPLTSLRLDGFAEAYKDVSSGDAAFARAGVPTVRFFTGFHDDDRASDGWRGVDASGAAEIATLALSLARDLATR
jgi:Peptidase family M28